MFSRVLARRPKSSLRRCLISFWCARENINIKPKRTLAGFARSFLTVAEAKNNKYCARTVRSRENEAFGWSRQCSVWLFDDLLWEVVGGVGLLPWRLTLTVDITYVWCVWGNTRRGELLNPSNMPSLEVTTFYDSRALHVSLVIDHQKAFQGSLPGIEESHWDLKGFLFCISFTDNMSARRRHVSPWKMSRKGTWKDSAGFAVGGGWCFWFSDLLLPDSWTSSRNVDI